MLLFQNTVLQNNIIDTMKSVCDSKLDWCHDGR